MVQFLVSFLFLQSSEEERAGCFTLIVIYLSCGCLCSVSLPRGIVGCSVVCDCGISWSYLLVCFCLLFGRFLY